MQDTYSPSRIDTDDPRKLADLTIKLQWKNTQVNLRHYLFEVDNFYEIGSLSNGVNSRDSRLSSLSFKQDFNWQPVNSYVWFSYNRSTFKSSAQLTAPGDLAAVSNPTSNEALYTTIDWADYSEFLAKWHNNWDINKQSSFQFGIELRHIHTPESLAGNNFDLRDLANKSIPIRFYDTLLTTTPVQASSNRDIGGLYGQYQCQLAKKVHLTLGLRHDEFSNIGSQLSPRLGLVQELNDHHSLKLLYGKAFRAPSELELNLRNNPILLGNTNLKPETVRTYDLIWVGQWSHTGTSLGYFENHYRDSIVQAEIGGLLQYSNVTQNPSKGFEFELSHEFNELWLLRITYTHISEKPDLSFREADQVASLMVDFQQNAWNANLTAGYHGEREMSTGGSESNRITLDDYWLLFAKVQYHFTPSWHGFVQAKNLSDEDHLTPPMNATLTERIPNRGREILTGIIWQF